MELKVTKTHDISRLRSRANRSEHALSDVAERRRGGGQKRRRGVYFFRSTAEGENRHAHGHSCIISAVGGPATDLAVGKTRDNLKLLIGARARIHGHVSGPKAAAPRCFEEIADWCRDFAQA